ncbi:MAG: hypothetical protein J6X30_01890 [Clostridia bacterium]|nr:hypothetical protein [Clostridia bacterium]
MIQNCGSTCACVSQALWRWQENCVRLIPTGRSEALSRENTRCTRSGIVYTSCCD